jgi:uncharacterized membrane protein
VILLALLRDRRGATTLVVAFSLLALIASAAVAVDVGSLYLASRRLQGVADAAALAAANRPSDPMGAATRTVTANALDATVAAAVPGRYAAYRATATAARFVAGGSSPDAVRVTLVQDAPLFFARALSGRATTRISASATAARIDYAAFSIGSRLAGVSGGLPGAILSALAGGDLSLSVMDYEALARADVDVLSFSRALGTRAGVSAGGFSDMLAASATLPQAVSAIADALAAGGGDPAAVAALRAAAIRVPGTTIHAADLIDPGLFAALDHGDARNPIRADALSLLREELAIAGGARQVAIDLPVSTGLASARLWLAVGERPAHSPWLAIARDGSVIVRTAQMRLYLDAKLAGAATLGLVSLRLPLYVELARASAKLSTISCSGGPANATVTLDVQPAIGSAAIADVDTGTLAAFGSTLMEKPAILAHALVVDLGGSAHVAIGGTGWTPVSFSRADIAAGTTRTVSTSDTARSLASSLAGGLALSASALSLSVPLPAVAGPVVSALRAAAPAVDTLLNQVLATLGIGLGQADVRVDGVRCGRPTLVA